MFKMCIDERGIPSEITAAGERGGTTPFGGDVVAPDEMSDELFSYFVGKLRAWRFTPRIEGGRPVPICTALVFRYDLKP